MKKCATQGAWIAGIAFLMGTSLWAQDTRTREINREFPVTAATTLEISNQYGNVNVMNHDRNTISLHVTVKVNMRDSERADAILKSIHIDISQEGNLVKAVTRFDDSFSRITRGFNIGGGGIEITYAVTMPHTVPLNLENKYGSVFVDMLSSTSTLDVKYGKLNANRIIHDASEPFTKILLAYSDATIQETQWINADIKYSKLNITDSKALVVVSKYSKVFITKGTSLVSDSRYDTYETGPLSNLVINTAYSNLKVERLDNKLQVDSKYTDVSVGSIPAGFESLRISSSYGNYRLNIAPEANYRLEGYAKYGNIDYPASRAKVNRFNENNELKVNGTIGSSTSPSPLVSINTTYGTVRLVP